MTKKKEGIENEQTSTKPPSPSNSMKSYGV